MGHIVRFSFDAKGKLPYYSRIEARGQEKAMAESIEGEMAAEELDRICTQLYGTPRWQTALSRELRVNDRRCGAGRRETRRFRTRWLSVCGLWRFWTN